MNPSQMESPYAIVRNSETPGVDKELSRDISLDLYWLIDEMLDDFDHIRDLCR